MEKWVSKIEATLMFKVTERTLDNWVKSGKINKTRKNGQICYEVSSIMEERNIFDHKVTSRPPTEPTSSSIEAANDLAKGPSKNEVVLEARLDEKQDQINILSEKLERKYLDLNTLALNHGGVSEKVKLFQNEIEILRKEKEDLRNEKEVVLKQKESLSEKSFSRFGTYLFVFMMVLLVSAGIGAYIWKNNQSQKVIKDSFVKDNGLIKSELEGLQATYGTLKGEKEKLRQDLANLIQEQDKTVKEKTSELMNKTIEVCKQLVEKEKQISVVEKTVLVSNQKVSEEKERVSELRKQIERLQKAQKETIKENSALKIKIGIANALKKLPVISEKEGNPSQEVGNHVIENSTE